jgi:hypothetical protein
MAGQRFAMAQGLCRPADAAASGEAGDDCGFLGRREACFYGIRVAIFKHSPMFWLNAILHKPFKYNG